MRKINKGTRTHKLFVAFQDGERLTASQIGKRFSIGNPRAEVTRVRQAGYAIYANRDKASNGKIVTKYALGTPSRNIVALGYLARHLGLVA